MRLEFWTKEKFLFATSEVINPFKVGDKIKLDLIFRDHLFAVDDLKIKGDFVVNEIKYEITSKVDEDIIITTVIIVSKV